jgi:hypothetical protein
MSTSDVIHEVADLLSAVPAGVSELTVSVDVLRRLGTQLVVLDETLDDALSLLEEWRRLGVDVLGGGNFSTSDAPARSYELTWPLENNVRSLTNVHDVSKCAGQHCTLHNRSNHHMRGWKQHWRDDRKIMERICPEHGVGHPDPDSPWPPESHEWVHGCCGCCLPPEDDRE